MNSLEDEVGFKPAARGPLLPVVVHLVLWIGLGLLLYFAVPKVEAAFLDFGLDLPAMTALVIKASMVVIKFYWMLLPVLILLAVVDRVILDRLRRRPDGRRAAWIWSGLMMALPLGAIAFLAVALAFPLTQAFHKLSG